VTEARRFGEELRRQRQERNVSLAAISRETKVSETLYAALERGDCSRWPSGIYSRSYVRDYAVAVGLEPDRVVAEFVACFVEIAAPGGDPAGAGTDRSRAAPGGEPLRLSLAPVPGELWRNVARSGVIALTEVLLLAAAAGVLALPLEFDFWRTLAGVALAWLALGRILPLFDCVDATAGLSSLRWLSLERVRSFTRLRPPSSRTAVWWPRRPQRS
jgi:transcriptional regulator with XRE-family HTH domain